MKIGILREQMFRKLREKEVKKIKTAMGRWQESGMERLGMRGEQERHIYSHLDIVYTERSERKVRKQKRKKILVTDSMATHTSDDRDSNRRTVFIFNSNFISSYMCTVHCTHVLIEVFLISIST